MSDMIYATEKLDDVLMNEMDDLIQDYYDTTAAKEGIPPYNFKWEQYVGLQELGMLLITTARDEDDTLLGFTIYFIMDAMHHRGWVMAQCDSLSVHKDARGRGIAKELMQFTISVLRTMKVQTITNHYRVCYDTTPVFEKLGFKVTDHVYSLTLGE